MKVEYINGVKTVWHSDKEETLQNMADLLFRLLYENWRKVNGKKVQENDNFTKG